MVIHGLINLLQLEEDGVKNKFAFKLRMAQCDFC